MVILAAFLLVFVYGLTWVPSIYRHARIYYWQRQCLTHPIAPGILIYSTGPPVLANASPTLSGLIKADRSAHIWAGKLAATNVVYLGTRRASNGLERLIVVTAVVNAVPQTVYVGFNVMLAPQGFGATYTQPMVFGMSGLNDQWKSFSRRAVPELLVYSAVEDPADSSHFSFESDAGIWHYVIDCRLQPDGSLQETWKQAEWFTTPQGTRGTVGPGTPGSFTYSAPQNYTFGP